MSDLDYADMSEDPFDDVVEIEPTIEDSAEESEEVVEEDGKPSEEEEDSEDQSESDGEAEESDAKEDDKDAEKEAEESDESGEEGSDEKPLPELAKTIEDGSLEIEIGEAKVTLKDLKNDYIGQKEISKRFTEIDKTSKQLEADTQEINGYIRQFATHLRDGDAVGAMQYFGEFAGQPPHMVKEQLIAALRPEVLRREGMSPMEIQNETLNSQNEYLTQQRESENERRANEQAQAELGNSINEIRETNGISEDEWQSTKSHLEKTLSDGENVTPELVKDTVIYSRMYTQAESIVAASGEQLSNADQWVEELVNVKEQYPDFTDDDLKEVLANAIESSRKTSTEQKMAEKVSTKKVAPKQTKNEPIAEEIDPELEDWL